MELNKKSWRDLIVFKSYDMNRKIFVKNPKISIKLNAPSASLSKDDLSLMNLFMKNNDLTKILGKELSVEWFSKNSYSVNTKESKLNFNLKDWNYEIKVGSDVVSFDDLMKEFAIKNAKVELEMLYASKTKNGDFFEFGKKSIREFFCANEERYFGDFLNLFVENQFRLPDNPDLKKELLSFVEKSEPGAAKFLEDNIPTLSQNSKGKERSLSM